jgi:Domain of unknown function (DUF6458)
VDGRRGKNKRGRKERRMTLRTSLLLLVIGAILRFAITADVSGIDIQILGVILMLVGLPGVTLWLYRTMLAFTRRRRERLQATLVEFGEPQPYRPDEPDPSVTSEIESAHQLADKARPFLEAEGYSSQRIDELALAFAARGVGWNLEEFIDWALAQGRLDPSLDA